MLWGRLPLYISVSLILKINKYLLMVTLREDTRQDVPFKPIQYVLHPVCWAAICLHRVKCNAAHSIESQIPPCAGQGCWGGTTWLLNAGLNAFLVVRSCQSNKNKLLFSEDLLMHLPLGKCTKHSRSLLNFNSFLYACNRIDCSFSLGYNLVVSTFISVFQLPRGRHWNEVFHVPHEWS